MAMLRLTCDGCGANLDAIDERGDPEAIVECGYCGAHNRLRRRRTDPQLRPPPEIPTPPVTPTWPPPPQPSPPAWVPPSPTRVLRVWTYGFMAIVGLGYLVFMIEMLLVKFELPSLSSSFGGEPETTLAGGQPYTWRSAHPFIVDLDDDGTDDVLGLIQTEDGRVRLAALAGDDWTALWQHEVATQRGLTPLDLRLHYEPRERRAWLVHGPTLIDFDARTGDERLRRELPATITSLAVLGEQLWVELEDGRAQRYDLDGFNDTWGFAPDLREDQLLRDDLGFGVAVPGPARDLDGVVFAELDHVASYCLDGVAPVAAQTVSATCKATAGLAWAQTADQRPVLVGYELDGKAERWRVELESLSAPERLRPGTGVWAAAIDSSDALVAFAPEDSALRLRRLSRLDGATRWEVVVIGDGPGQVEGLQVVGDRIYLVQAGVLHIRETGSGAVVHELGG